MKLKKMPRTFKPKKSAYTYKRRHTYAKPKTKKKPTDRPRNSSLKKKEANPAYELTARDYGITTVDNTKEAFLTKKQTIHFARTRRA